CYRLHRQRHRAARVRPCQHRSYSSTRRHRCNPFLLSAVVTTLVVLVTFVFTTLIHEPASLVTLLVIVALSMALDMAWKRSRDRRQVVSYAAGVRTAATQAVRVVRARTGHRVATSHVMAPANIPMAAPPTTSTGQCAPM